MPPKAAMALRAYYAGHTVVEASSSGLESGRVQLEFTGAPEYEEGKSVQVLSRPYVRFAAHRVKPELQTYGPNSPTFASTSAEGYSPGRATDGNNSTYWKPQESDAAPYLTLDVERTLDLYGVSVLFAEHYIGTFKVELSADQVNWEIMSSVGEWEDAWWKSAWKRPVKARFIRFSFPDGPQRKCPALAEVEVQGILPTF